MKPPKYIKVKITGFKDQRNWYACFVGKEFKVFATPELINWGLVGKEHSGFKYRCIDKVHLINVDDCTVVVVDPLKKIKAKIKKEIGLK